MANTKSKSLDLELKQKVIKKFIDHKKEYLEGLEQDQQNKLDKAKRDEIESKQIESKNDETISELDFLNKNITALQKEIEFLERTHAEAEMNSVGLGSLVKTDKATFLVAVAQETVKVDGKEIAGISLQAPIFKAMEGKEEGYTAEVGEVKHKILEIV